MLVEDERSARDLFKDLIGSGLEAPRKARHRARRSAFLRNATPVIVLADADLDAAAEKLAANAFSFAGQSCISVQRIYTRNGCTTISSRGFLPKVEGLVLGDPADEDTDVGPVIDDESRERILSWIEEARWWRRDPCRRRPGRPSSSSRP